MKQTLEKCRRSRPAFTLVELLVVISIIAVVAGLVVAAAGSSSIKKMEKQTAAQMSKLEIAIEGFKGTYGTLPPTDPAAADHRINTLFYELSGTHYIKDSATPANSVYRSAFDPTHQLTTASIQAIFGSAVAGIVNNSVVTSNASPFIEFRSNSEYQKVTGGIYLLKVPAMKPAVLANPSVSNDGENFWFYRAYPANGYNPTGYDLWAVIPGKGRDTNVISNWKR